MLSTRVCRRLHRSRVDSHITDVKKISAQPCKSRSTNTSDGARKLEPISLPISLNFLCVTCFVSIMQF